MIEDFEQRLRHQPPREIPSAWRQEILAAADQRTSVSTATPPLPWLAGLFHQLFTRSFQLRWGAVAAGWLVILALNHAARDNSAPVTAKASVPSPQLVAALREQKRLLAELSGPGPDALPVDRPKSGRPGPHSQRQEKAITNL